MNKDAFFCHLDSTKIADFIRSAERAVVYAAPSIQMLPAQAMVDVSKKLEPLMLTVNMDIDEHVLRMGYGELKAIELLMDCGISINHSPQLRTALIIVDNHGFSFTSTALFLEPENASSTAFNAIRLSSEQVVEALARLSPVAKSIAVAQASTEQEKQRLESLPIDIASSPITDESIKDIKKGLDKAPPVDFDVARQVRVYESYLQYVEVSLNGAALQNRTITIPTSIQAVGEENEALKGRLTERFNLIENNNELSSSDLNKGLAKIRKDFTQTVKTGSSSERFLLKRMKPRFEDAIAKFRQKITDHQDKVKDKLEKYLSESRTLVAQHYLPIVKSKTPIVVITRYKEDPSDDDCMEWILGELDSVFPLAADLIKDISLDISYKDITFETLRQPEFLQKIKEVYPYESWNKAHEEYVAAGQRQ